MNIVILNHFSLGNLYLILPLSYFPRIVAPVLTAAFQVPLYPYQHMVWDSFLLFFKNFSHPNRCVVISFVVLMFISLMTDDVSIFLCLLALCVSSLV